MTHVLKHALLLDEKSPLLFQSIQKKNCLNYTTYLK